MTRRLRCCASSECRSVVMTSRSWCRTHSSPKPEDRNNNYESPMAKKSSIEKNERRKRMTLQYAAKRKAFKAVMHDPKATDAQKLAAQTGLQKLPRNSAPERVRNR